MSKYNVVIPFNLDGSYQQDVLECVNGFDKSVEVTSGVRSSNQLVAAVNDAYKRNKTPLIILSLSDKQIPVYLHDQKRLPEVDQISLRRQCDYAHDSSAIHEDTLYHGLTKILIEGVPVPKKDTVPEESELVLA